MIENATGLILRTQRLTDTSLIVQWLTPQWGRLSTVAKGARRFKSPFLGRLDLFYQADFSFSRARRSQLHLLREVNLLNPRPVLRRDLARLRPALYAAALIEQSTETDTPLPGVFEHMQGFLDGLCGQSPGPPLVFAFELKLLHELGLDPDLEKAGLTAGAKQIAQALRKGDWSAGGRLKPSVSQVTELKQFLTGFLIYHLGRLPRGRTAALAD